MHSQSDDWSTWDASKARPEHEQTERYKNAPQTFGIRASTLPRNNTRLTANLSPQLPDNVPVTPSPQAGSAAFASRSPHERAMHINRLPFKQQPSFTRPHTHPLHDLHDARSCPSAVLSDANLVRRSLDNVTASLKLAPTISNNTHASDSLSRYSGTFRYANRAPVKSRHSSLRNHASFAQGKWNTSAASGHSQILPTDLHSPVSNAFECGADQFARFSKLIPPAVAPTNSVSKHNPEGPTILGAEASTPTILEGEPSIATNADPRLPQIEVDYILHIPTEFESDLSKRKQLHAFVSKLFNDGTLSLRPDYGLNVFPGLPQPQSSLTLRGEGAQQAAKRLVDLFIEYGSDMYFVLHPDTRAALRDVTRSLPVVGDDASMAFARNAPKPLLRGAPPIFHDGTALPTSCIGASTYSTAALIGAAAGQGREIDAPVSNQVTKLPNRQQLASLEFLSAQLTESSTLKSQPQSLPAVPPEAERAPTSPSSIRAVHWLLESTRTRGTLLGVKCCNLHWVSKLSGMYVSIEASPMTLGTPRKLTIKYPERIWPAQEQEEADLMFAVECVAAIGEMVQPGRFLPKLYELPPALGIRSPLEIVDNDTKAFTRQVIAAASVHKPPHSTNNTEYHRIGPLEVLSLLLHLWKRNRPNRPFPLEADLERSCSALHPQASGATPLRSSTASEFDAVSADFAENVETEVSEDGAESLHTFWQRFSASASDDDGYITPLQMEADLYMEWAARRPSTYKDRLAAIGSATWALQNLADTILACGFSFKGLDLGIGKLHPSVLRDGRRNDADTADEGHCKSCVDPLAPGIFDGSDATALGDWLAQVDIDNRYCSAVNNIDTKEYTCSAV